MNTPPRQKLQIFTDEGTHVPPSFHKGCLIRVAESLLSDYGWGKVGSRKSEVGSKRQETRSKKGLPPQRYSASGEVVLVLTDDATLHGMNRRYRGIDRPTDVLSFDVTDDDEATGEVYVSLPTAERQASEFGVPVVEELYRLFLHGLLHITGRDDQTEEEAAAMMQETERYLGCLMDFVKECDLRRG